MSETEKKDLVLSIGAYVFTQDKGSAEIRVAKGPAAVNVTGQEYPVVYDHKNRRFNEVSLYEAVQQSPLADQGSYIELWNPSFDPDGVLKIPTEGKGNPSPSLRMGERVNIPGPVTFSLWPQQHARVIPGHRLRSNQYLEIQVYDEDAARENWGDALIKTADPTDEAPQGQAFSDIDSKDFTVGKKFVIRGTDVSFFIPPTGIEVVPDPNGETDTDGFIREALTLQNMYYCILMDESGEKRYEQGPAVVFPRPTERFFTRKKEKAFKATELNNVSGVYIKVIADYTEDDTAKTERKAGDELFITGKDTTIYFPREEHSLVRYEGNAKHFAVAVPKGEARYVMSRTNAEVRMAKGYQMLLPDPRTEVVLKRILTEKECELWYPGNDEAAEFNTVLRDVQEKSPSTRAGVSEKELLRHLSKGGRDASPMMARYAMAASNAVMADESDVHSAKAGAVADEWERGSTYQEPRTLILDTKYSGVPTICPWQNNAVQIVDKSGNRRVIVGPETAMLQYDEVLEVLALSTGKPKTTDRIERTVYLRTKNNGVSDIIDDVETKDHVRCEVKLRYMVNFEAETLEDRNKWFEVENYTKLSCDHIRSILKNHIKKLTIREFNENAADIIRGRILGERAEGTGRPGMFFPENGMRVTEVEVLYVRIGDKPIAQLLEEQQHHVVSSDIALDKARKALEVEEEQQRLRQAVLMAKAKTAQFEAGLEIERIERGLVVQQKQVEANKLLVKEQGTEQELRDALESTKQVARINRDKADAELQNGMATAAVQLEAQRVEIVTNDVTARFKAAEGPFSEAIQLLGNHSVAEKVAEATSVQAMLGGKNAKQILVDVLEGTGIQGFVQHALENSAKRGTNGDIASPAPRQEA